MLKDTLTALALTTALLTTPALADRSITIAEDGLPTGGAIAVPVLEGAFDQGSLAALDAATDGAVTAAMADAAFTGQEGKTLSLYGLSGYAHILLVGLGEGEISERDLEDFGGRVAQAVSETQAENVAVLWGGLESASATPGAQIAYGAALGQYSFSKYQTEDEDEDPDAGPKSLTIHTTSASADQAAFTGEWQPVADAVHFARDLINEPANVIYPESFVSRTRAAFAGERNIRIDVLDVDDMAERNMGALLGVGQGSERPPRLLVIRYTGGERGDAPLAFVGKGVTFDTGGISLKGSNGMWRMKYDMSGAAAAVGGVLALARRDAAVNAVAIAGLAENMPSANAQRPGDIVTTMSGKTIEVLNTDAEGRLVLADAVWYAQEEFNPQAMINLATLTGSVRVALGDEYAGLFSRHDDFAEMVTASSERAGEPVWRLPLHPSYAEDIRSNFADIKNISGERLAGAGIGAQVIGTFVKEDTVWASLDIASTAWPNENMPTVPNNGGAGYGVRLINQIVRDHYEAR